MILVQQQKTLLFSQKNEKKNKPKQETLLSRTKDKNTFLSTLSFSLSLSLKIIEKPLICFKVGFLQTSHSNSTQQSSDLFGKTESFSCSLNVLSFDTIFSTGREDSKLAWF